MQIKCLNSYYLNNTYIIPFKLCLDYAYNLQVIGHKNLYKYVGQLPTTQIVMSFFYFLHEVLSLFSEVNVSCRV